MFSRRAEANWHTRNGRCGKLKSGNGQFSQEIHWFNIFTGQLPVSALLRRTCHTSQLPAAGRNHRAGSDVSIACSCLGITQPKGTAGLTF